jgi:hypothetical protein
MEASSAITAQIAQTRTEIAYSAIKQSADSEKAIADILQSAISSVPGSPIRGVNVNVKA